MSTLFAYSQHGDPFKSSLLKLSLEQCIIPIRDMIIEWVCDGQIRDAHEEVRDKRININTSTKKYLFFEVFCWVQQSNIK